MFATLLGAMHHHNDLKQHNNCQVCTIQANIANADTPVDVVYLTQLDIYSESIVAELKNLHAQKPTTHLFPRAPPFFS
jgi:flagellar basal body rod protein FlgB